MVAEWSLMQKSHQYGDSQSPSLGTKENKPFPDCFLQQVHLVCKSEFEQNTKHAQHKSDTKQRQHPLELVIKLSHFHERKNVLFPFSWCCVFVSAGLYFPRSSQEHPWKQLTVFHSFEHDGCTLIWSMLQRNKWFCWTTCQLMNDEWFPSST